MTSKDTMRWYTAGSGNIELQLRLEDARAGAHQGCCDDDIADLRKVGYISAQLDKLEPSAVAAELKEFGAWDKRELSDHDANLSRLLWIACGDIVEESNQDNQE